MCRGFSINIVICAKLVDLLDTWIYIHAYIHTYIYICIHTYSRCQKYESSLNFCQKFEKSMSPVRIECVFLILNNIITLCHNNV